MANALTYAWSSDDATGPVDMSLVNNITSALCDGAVGDQTTEHYFQSVYTSNITLHALIGFGTNGQAVTKISLTAWVTTGNGLFSLYGSNDGTQWSQVVAPTTITGVGGFTTQTATFASTNFRYWQLVITSSGPGGSHAHFTDVRLYDSASVLIAAPTGGTAPGTATGLTSVVGAKGQVQHTWTDPATGTPPFTYLLGRGYLPGSEGIGAQFIVGNSYTDTVPSGGTSYTYYIKALNQYGQGGNSIESTVAVPAFSVGAVQAGSTATVLLQLDPGGNYWNPGTPGTPTFTVSGTAGATIISQTVVHGQVALITLSVPSKSGTIVLTDPSNSLTYPIDVLGFLGF